MEQLVRSLPYSLVISDGLNFVVCKVCLIERIRNSGNLGHRVKETIKQLFVCFDLTSAFGSDEIPQQLGILFLGRLVKAAPEFPTAGAVFHLATAYS